MLALSDIHDCCSTASRADAQGDTSCQSEVRQPGNEEMENVQAENQSELWSEAVQIQEAKERAIWHEKMSRHSLEQSEALQVKLPHLLQM